MAPWRVLGLSQQPHSSQIPQLLVKADFTATSYKVHLTCLSHIWSEELDLDDIVHRASQEQSPIEVSKHDTTQLAILLDNIEKSLGGSDGAVSRISREDDDGVTIQTSIALPAPLDSLTWRFNLKKRDSTTLKNELILPLILSSHIQHERIGRLITAVKDKDKAIIRLVDQFESSSLDLATAFPIISGLKSGRKLVKREQVAKHVPALQPFSEKEFKDTTSSVEDSDVTTLGLFQEALSECGPEVPRALQSDKDSLTWWHVLPARLGPIKAAKPKPVVKKEGYEKKKASSDGNASGEETEDEFEVHENFKSRGTEGRSAVPVQIIPNTAKDDDDVTDDTEEDDDLDAPPSQKSTKGFKTTSSTTNAESPSPAMPRNTGFRIGGRLKQATETPPLARGQEPDGKHDDLPVRHSPSSPPAEAVEASPKKVKKGFKIGGKGKTSTGEGSQTVAPDVRPEEGDHVSRPNDAKTASSPLTRTDEEESMAEEPAREETAEEKAERRRAELKRKTDEAAKKQGQQKKKRRF